MAIEASVQVYIATAAALLGAICVGVAVGFTGPALETMLQVSNSNSTDRIATDKSKSLIGSSITLGALVGSLIGGIISQKAGRKKALIIYGVPFAIGCGVIYIAKSVFVVIIGRVIAGFSAGMISVTAPSYIAEISTPNTRGFLGSGFQIFVNVGIFLMAFFGIFATESFNYFFNWRYLAAFGILPGISLSISMIKMPESPTWLMANYGPTSDEPQKALSTLRTTKSDILKELDELQEETKKTASSTMSPDQLKRPDYWKPAVCGMALMSFQQLSGINIVMFFQTQILKDSRGTSDVTPAESSNYAAIGTAIVCFTQIIATVGGAFLMDRLGRRMLLLISGAGHVVALSVLGFYFYSRHPIKVIANNSTQLIANMTTTAIPMKSTLPSFLPVACLVVFVIAFSVGYGPIPWLMIPEMTPLAIRSTVSSVATAFNWSLAFITTFTFAPLSSGIGVSTTFWMYAFICVLSCIFVYLYLPETKGKSFDEIQREFAGGGISETTSTPKSKSSQSVNEGKSISDTAEKQPKEIKT